MFALRWKFWADTSLFIGLSCLIRYFPIINFMSLIQLIFTKSYCYSYTNNPPPQYHTHEWERVEVIPLI